MSDGGRFEQLGVGTPQEKPAPGVMARRHITLEPSTSNIGLRAPARQHPRQAD